MRDDLLPLLRAQRVTLPDQVWFENDGVPGSYEKAEWVPSPRAVVLFIQVQQPECLADGCVGQVIGAGSLAEGALGVRVARVERWLRWILCASPRHCDMNVVKPRCHEERSSSSSSDISCPSRLRNASGV